MQQVNHNNPCRVKVPTPILKHSGLYFSSQICQNNCENLVSMIRKQSCPQINKIRNKSVKNIVCFQQNQQRQADEGVEKGNYNSVNIRNNNGKKIEKNDCETKMQDKYEQNNYTSETNQINGKISTCKYSTADKKQIEDNNQNNCNSDNIKQNKAKTKVGQYVKKRSLQALLGAPVQKQKFNLHQVSQCQKYQHKNNIHLIPADYLDVILTQHNTLITQLSKKQSQLTQTQNQYFKLQQKYIRLLQISNLRSQSQIKILLESGQQRMNKSKLKNSTLSEQALKLKAKLQNLDLSGIKNFKENSFKISEAF